MTRFVPVLALFTLACQGDPQIGGQTGEVAAPFCEEDVTQLSLDEASVMGFSGEDILASFGGTQIVQADWFDGTSSPVEVTVSHDPTQGDGATFNTGSDPRCRDYVEIQVLVSVVSDNGALDFSFQEPLRAFDLDEARVYGVSSVMYNAGDLDAEDLSGASWDPNTASFYSDFTLGTAASGSIELETHSEETGDQVFLELSAW